MPLIWPRPTSIFVPPTTLDHFLTSPLKFLIYHLHQLLLYLRGPAYKPSANPQRPPLRIVCLSDTHSKIPKQPIPDGDILIHAGDLAGTGTAAEIQAQIDWLNSLPHAEKIVVGGNHDSFLDPESRLPEDGGEGAAATPLVNGDSPASSTRQRRQKTQSTPTLNWGPIHYLEGRSITLALASHANRRINIYGAPQIPRCGPSDFAFQYDEDSEDEWTDTVPEETDVLVTHTPPRFHRDLPAGLGCASLLNEIWRVRPTLHVCGHIHSAHGREDLWWDNGQRAYERVCARRRKRRVLTPAEPESGKKQMLLLRWAAAMTEVARAFLIDAFDVASWLDGIRVVWYGVKGFLWSRVWQGANTSGSILINASLTYQNTQVLGNPVQIVDI
ncbi:MAG: hypothetical protein M4579_001870 [Chaenotheca gracillima]|nr:MAG: hypothetical protein M4579_001870 [Chaenotheca gracillima]